jgi:hypothetical protein
MIKVRRPAIWIIAVTAGTVLFAYQYGQDQVEVEARRRFSAGWTT